MVTPDYSGNTGLRSLATMQRHQDAAKRTLGRAAAASAISDPEDMGQDASRHISKLGRMDFSFYEGKRP